MGIICLTQALRGRDMQEIPKAVAVIQSCKNSLSTLLSAYTEKSSGGGSSADTSASMTADEGGAASADADSQPSAGASSDTGGDSDAQ